MRLDSRKTRVAFVTQGLGRIVPPKAHGSIATWTYETAKQLAGSHDVLLLEFGDRPFTTSWSRHDAIQYCYIQTGPNRILNGVFSRLESLWRRLWSPERRLLRPPYSSLLHNLGFIVQAAWTARRWRADVIHVHNFSQFAPIMRVFNRGARIVLHMNCEWLSQHDADMIRHRIATTDAIIGCSKHIAGKVAARFPEFKDRCHVVFNGADVHRFAPAPTHGSERDAEPIRILFVGRISPEKGVHLLTEAFALVADRFPNAHLDLVGAAGSLPPDFLVALSDDPHVLALRAFYGKDYMQEVRSRIPAHLVGRVAFHGNRSHSELARHYSEAAIFVNPSLSDAFPLTVVEAMAAGLPVVASAVGGVRESVVHGSTGLLVTPNSAQALADGLAALLADSNLRRHMAEAARERALEHFSWTAIARSASELYGRLFVPTAITRSA